MVLTGALKLRFGRQPRISWLWLWRGAKTYSQKYILFNSRKNG